MKSLSWTNIVAAGPFGVIGGAESGSGLFTLLQD